MTDIINDVGSKISFQGGADYEGFQVITFLNILKEMNTDKPVMIELGSNDCFYSLIFDAVFKDVESKLNVCLEVSSNLLELGIANCGKLAATRFFFEHARIGSLDEHYFTIVEDPSMWGHLSSRTTTLKRLYEKYSIEKASVIHMDIQGSEIGVLEEIVGEDIPVDYLFISTHPESAFGATHKTCLDLLGGFDIIFQNEFDGGYGDGLIICKKINKPL